MDVTYRWEQSNISQIHSFSEIFSLVSHVSLTFSRVFMSFALSIPVFV